MGLAQQRAVTTEIGQLTTVLVHRPGAELQRLTSRQAGRLLFGTLPWVARARQEHDVLCEQLRAHGAEVLYFTELLQESLEYQPARDEAVRLAAADARLGDELRGQLRAYLSELDSEQLAQVLIAGLTPGELRSGHGVVFELLDRHDFVLEPLPNLVFTRDASFWVSDQVAVATPAPGRRREAGLAGVIYRHHPRFRQAGWLGRPGPEHLAGGDVLLLAPGVVAVGVGQQTTAAGAERLAGALFRAGVARQVLAVPLGRLPRPAGPAASGAAHLDTMCALVRQDAVLMHPAAAYTLTAHTITPGPDGLRMSRARPFLEAAAQAMGIDRLQVIDSGTEPSWGLPGRWDDGSNVLALAPGLVVSYERSARANAQLEEAGIRVLRVPGSELSSSSRGGPRCLTCAISRLPAPAGGTGPEFRPAQASGMPESGLPVSVPASREPSYSDAIRAIRSADPDTRAAPNPWPAGPAAAAWPAGTAAGHTRGQRRRWTSRGRLLRASGSAAVAAVPGPAAAVCPESPEPDAHDARDQGEQREPHQRPHDHRGDEHDEDDRQDHQQHPKHASNATPPAAPARGGRALSCGEGR